MAVAEYMFVIDDMGRKQVPGYIRDRGYWHNPSDNTYIGWIKENRDYWVPDTIVFLTKEQFLQRQLAIHSAFPMKKGEIFNNTQTDMTVEEVTDLANTWYDYFVAENSAKDATENV